MNSTKAVEEIGKGAVMAIDGQKYVLLGKQFRGGRRVISSATANAVEKKLDLRFAGRQGSDLYAYFVRRAA